MRPGTGPGLAAGPGSGRSRRWWIGLALAAVAALAGPAIDASAQQPLSLEPLLRELVRPDRRDAILRRVVVDPASEPATQPFGGSLAIERRRASDELMLGVFVRVRGSAGLEQIRAAGGELGAVLGDYASARIPLAALERLAASPDIERIEAARALRLEHDSSTRAIRVDQVRTLVGDEWRGATGQGAIVAVYDTGLDLLHEDFIDPQGRSRVLGLWDQTRTGTPPPGFNGGHYCSAADVQLAVSTAGAAGCLQRDGHGHGTHVAGTAAGDGSAGGLPGRPYTGVAPGADLLIVNGGAGVFFENLIIDGLTWLRQEGLRLARPVVANLSLGGQFGAHDGSRLYERMIDALSGPGFAVVISAGNNGVNGNTDPAVGGRLIHARGIPEAGDPREFDVILSTYVPAADRCNGNFVNISLWYEAADQLRIEVVRPSGSVAAAARGLVTTNESPNGRIRIDNGSGGPDPDNGDIEAMIAINGCGTSGAPEAGVWTIRVTPVQPGSGQPYDMWIASSAGIPNGGSRGFDNRFVVGSPGNARRAITVGAFVTRLCWPSVASANPTCYTQREAIGDVARFSSAGPTRDGRIKPEITAPGLGILSAHSRDATIAQNRLAPDGVHAAREGTSMSAPHVTGAVAIILAASPQLTPEGIKAILTGSALQDGFTTRTYDPFSGGSPSDWWGFGKLDVQGALLAISDGRPATLALETQPAAPPSATLGARGTRLPLLQLNLESRGFEGTLITAIGFDVTGDDAGARLLLLRDSNGDGRVDPQDAVVGSAAAPLTATKRRVVMRPASMLVPQFSRAPFFLALELSGQAPNGAVFEATLVPDELHSVGERSGAVDQFDGVVVAVSSGPAGTTVLRAGEKLTFGENPVRAAFVTFNFSQAPTTARIFTVTGRRVADLCADPALRCGAGGGDAWTRWALENDDGNRVAPGVYLVIFEVDGTVFREKLMILTPARAPDGPEL